MMGKTAITIIIHVSNNVFEQIIMKHGLRYYNKHQSL